MPEAVKSSMLCYNSLHVCRVNSLPFCQGIDENIINLGQDVAHHTINSSQSISNSISNRNNNLIVVFVSGRRGSRLILNENEILAYCKSIQDITCISHSFGKDFQKDVELIQNAHVLIYTS